MSDACAHQDFVAHVDVNRLTDEDEGPVVAYSAEITIECLNCGEPFHFMGCPVGMLPTRPATDPVGAELRAPIRPRSSDPTFGLGIAGFAMRVQMGDENATN